MDLMDLLNKNPVFLLALFSLIAFPCGLLFLGYVAKKLGVGSLVKVMSDHVAAEVKIEGRLQEIVSEIKNMVAANWDNRRYYDEKIDHFDHRFTLLDEAITRLVDMMPKRKGDN
jgi:hypothetical protein